MSCCIESIPKTRSYVKDPWASLDYTKNHGQLSYSLLHPSQVRYLDRGVNLVEHTSMVHVSSESKVTIGLPPDSSSILFWGRNRATTLILLADMVAASGAVVSRSRNRHQGAIVWLTAGVGCVRGEVAGSPRRTLVKGSASLTRYESGWRLVSGA